MLGVSLLRFSPLLFGRIFVRELWMFTVVIGPMIFVALFVSNIITHLLPEKLVVKWMRSWPDSSFVRYVCLPIGGLIVLGNPRAYELGKLLKDKYKPSFYDATVSFCHPITAVFPYANSGELLFWIGAAYATVITKHSLMEFIFVYLGFSIFLMYFRGVTTAFLLNREA